MCRYTLLMLPDVASEAFARPFGVRCCAIPPIQHCSAAIPTGREQLTLVNSLPAGQPGGKSCPT